MLKLASIIHDDRSTHVKRIRKPRLAEGLGSTRETCPQRRPSIGSRTSKSLHILFRVQIAFESVRDGRTRQHLVLGYIMARAVASCTLHDTGTIVSDDIIAGGGIRRQGRARA